MPGRRHVPQYGGHGAIRYAEDSNKLSLGIAPENRDYEQSVETARKQGELELRVGSCVIRSEYQKRLDEVAIQRAKSQQALVLLESERASLLQGKESVLALMKDFESTLQVNVQWLGIQKSIVPEAIPSTELKKHRLTVHESLEASIKDIKGILLHLVTHLTATQAAVVEADEAIRILKEDIITKSSSMVMDKACMEGLVTTDAATAAVPGSPRAPLTYATSRTKQSGMMSIPSPRRSDTDWQRKGEAAAAHGLHIVERITPVRRAAQEYASRVRQEGRLQRNTAVVDALRNQIKCGEQLDHQLELNQKTMTSQLAINNRQQAAISIALGNVEEQLRIANERLRVSNVRPATDCAPSNVEDTLGMEITKLKRSQLELNGKLTGLSGHNQRTETMVKTLQQQSTATRSTLEQAKACLDVKLPPISVPSPRKSYSMSTPRLQ